ncbi:MAG: ABC transporter substrate-binding protein, partial [Chloroflexota bacterium]|nr:ABC transporter substrate-binding protein [Chloroflexota bacterium]
MTRTRKLWTLLSSVVIFGLLLAACAPAATPTPKPVAQPTVAPTPVPQVVAPTPVPPTAAKPTPLPATATPAPAPKPEAKAGEEPRYGGVLKVLNNTDLPHFDMHQETTSKMQNPLSPAYNHLVTWDAADENKVLPGLAERWEASPDGKVYTFYLRKGVKFHDGKPLTAADVKVTFDRQAGFTDAFSPRKDWLAALQRVEVVDDLTVKMYLKYPS